MSSVQARRQHKALVAVHQAAIIDFIASFADQALRSIKSSPVFFSKPATRWPRSKWRYKVSRICVNNNRRLFLTSTSFLFFAVVAVALVGLVFFMKRSVAAKDAHVAAE